MTLPPSSTLEQTGSDRPSAIRRLAVTFVTFVGAMALLATHALTGQGDAQASLTVGLFGLFGFAGFYLAQTRLPPERRNHVRLVFAQVVFHILLISLSYTLVDSARGLALQLLCLVVVFDARRLPWRLTLAAAALTTLLPALGMLVRWQLLGPDPDQEMHLLFLALGSLAAPVMLLAAMESRRLRRRKREQRDALAETLEQLHQLSLHDSLTGVYNRQHIHALLAMQLQRLQRGDGPSCLALLDLDHFRQVQETHGQAAGDAVLLGFARCVQDSLRGTPLALGRWSSDAFLLLLPDSDERETTAALLHLHRALRLHDWSACASGLAITASIGAVKLDGDLSAAQAVEAAERALQQARSQGRNRSAWAAGAPPSPQAAQARRAEARNRVVPSGIPAALSPSAAKTAPRSRWSIWLLGQDRDQRRASRQCLGVLTVNVTLIITALVYRLPPDFWSPAVRLLFISLLSIGAFVPYVLVRSGLTRRLADPAMVAPQMQWASMQLALGVALLPPARGYCLQMMCVVLVFGFISLRQREVVITGVSTILMLLASHAALALRGPPGHDLLLQALELTGTVTVLSLLCWLSYGYARLRALLDREAAELAAATERVSALLSVDPMTGLPNQQHMQLLVGQAGERHARSGRPFCVALIDLDQFSQVNEKHGPAVGDELLLHFARHALQLGRATDVLGRWGGDEFLLLSEAESAASSLRYLERLRAALQQAKPRADLPQLRVDFSAGLACLAPGEPLSQLLDRAEQALQAAKAQGRGHHVVAEDADCLPRGRYPAAGRAQAVRVSGDTA